MRLAVTGATGLLGSCLTKYFIEKGDDVYVLLKDDQSSSKLGYLGKIVYGNINSRSDVDNFVQKSSPDYFVHLAAQTQVHESVKFPYETFYTNSVGTLNVLEALREFSATRAIVVASSEKAYGLSTSSEYLEKSPLDGKYPYDASKVITEIICRAYKSTYSMPIATTRACNIYGKGDYNQSRLIPAILHAYKTREAFVMRNGGEEIREYIHVEDVVRAYDSILEYVSQQGTEESFNISSGERFKAKEIVEMVQKHLKRDVPILLTWDDAIETRKDFMNSDLLRLSTGWRPLIHFESSLGEIVQWYLKN